MFGVQIYNICAARSHWLFIISGAGVSWAGSVMAAEDVLTIQNYKTFKQMIDHLYFVSCLFTCCYIVFASIKFSDYLLAIK